MAPSQPEGVACVFPRQSLGNSSQGETSPPHIKKLTQNAKVYADLSKLANFGFKLLFKLHNQSFMGLVDLTVGEGVAAFNVVCKGIAIAET